MFRGINSATLDAKGRMAIPARLRDSIAAESAGKLVLTIDVRDRCLLLYTLPAWEIVQEELVGLANMNEGARLLQRLLIGHASDLDMDASGRILVPPKLRESAALDKAVILAGQGNKLEVWAEQAWNDGMPGWLEQARALLASDPTTFTGLSV